MEQQKKNIWRKKQTPKSCGVKIVIVVNIYHVRTGVLTLETRNETIYLFIYSVPRPS